MKQQNKQVGFIGSALDPHFLECGSTDLFLSLSLLIQAFVLYPLPGMLSLVASLFPKVIEIPATLSELVSTWENHPLCYQRTLFTFSQVCFISLFTVWNFLEQGFLKIIMAWDLLNQHATLLTKLLLIGEDSGNRSASGAVVPEETLLRGVWDISAPA